MAFNWRTQRNAVISIATVYVVGIVGFVWWPQVFQELTVVNLLYVSLLVFALHRNWSLGFATFAFITALIGFLVEWLGVATGVIFGEYAYGNALGWKLFDIPLLIGLNWLLLVYCTGTIAAMVKIPWWLQAVLGAALMVLMDVLIEPFAIRYDLWAWEGNVIPLQNYVAWFGVALLLQLPFHYCRFAEKNRVAVALFISQLVFFGLLLLINE